MQTTVQANPFVLLMDPAAVIAAVERSERLAHLKSRVCRPLDRPMIPLNGSAAQAYDRAVDEEPAEEEAGE